MITTIGIDSSSKCCGVAVYRDGKYFYSFVLEFKDVFTYDKLKLICSKFEEVFTVYEPDIVLIEEPLMVRNGKISRTLNLIGGALFGIAARYTSTVDLIHNKTIKKYMGIVSKEDSVALAEKLHKIKVATNDESDAIMIVETYLKMTGVNS